MSAALHSTSFQVSENVPLAPLTTMGVGGSARFFGVATTESALIEALDFARRNHLPEAILGGGSNLLVRDAGFPGLVIHLRIKGELKQTSVADHVHVRVPAGMDWDALVRTLAEQDLCGMECLAGIPGLTGGTPVQNVGAYGQEVAQTIASVRAFDRVSSRFVEIAAEDCRFSYRSSRFNGPDRDRFVLTAVTFRIDRRARPQLRYADLRERFGDATLSALDVYTEVRKIRQSKGMLLTTDDPDCRSAGSFFKNPIVSAATLESVAAELALQKSDVSHWPASPGYVKLAAAWLLERAGYHRGFARGRVGISSRHTLALINRGGATFADLVGLRDEIRQTVRERFAIELEQEPVEIGEQPA